MLLLHHRCELCRAGGITDSFWLDKNALLEHMSTDHYACNHPSCHDVLIAFATKDELLQHQVEYHPTMFTQQELEQHQLRLFKKKTRKRRDVTQEVLLARFSIQNRATDLQETHSFRTRAGRTPAVDDDTLFQMHMKLAIANSLKTAKDEAKARLAGTLPSGTSSAEDYNPATELLMRHREVESTTSLVTPIEPLPTANYHTPSSLSVDKPTSVQATLQYLLEPTSPQPSYKPGAPIALTRAQLEERLTADLGVKFRTKKKAKTQISNDEGKEAQAVMERAKGIEPNILSTQQHLSEPEDASKMTLSDFGHMDDLAGFPSAPSLSSIPSSSIISVSNVQPLSTLDRPDPKVEVQASQAAIERARQPSALKTSVQAVHEAFLESIKTEENPQPTTVAPLVIRKNKKKRSQYAD